MRIIDSTNLGNTPPAQTGRTGALDPSDSSGKAGSTRRDGSSTSDSVELSGFTERLSRTMEEAAATRAQRVQELSAVVRSGSYRVYSKAVSHAMVSQAISSGSSGKP